jgi:hypothetical protein
MDWTAVQQRLADIVAEPRANIPAVAVLSIIVVAFLILIAVLLISSVRRGRGESSQVIVDAQGKRYMIVASAKGAETDPRAKRWRRLSVAFLVASVASAVLAWIVTSPQGLA